MPNFKETKRKLQSRIESVKKINDNPQSSIDSISDKYLNNIPSIEDTVGKKADQLNSKVNKKIQNTKDIFKDMIDVVCYYENPETKLKRVKENIRPQFFKNPIYSIQSYFNTKRNIKELNRLLPKYSNNVFYSNHHESHLYYSFYTSNFENYC
jgi:predicted NodU family carbamoyl transferase